MNSNILAQLTTGLVLLVTLTGTFLLGWLFEWLFKEVKK